MAIINTNTVYLRNGAGTIDSSLIVQHDWSNQCRKARVIKFHNNQVDNYASYEVFEADFKDTINIKGWVSMPDFEYNFETNTEPLDYFVDLKLKEHLINIYPEWDADKLVITTEPTEEA